MSYIIRASVITEDKEKRTCFCSVEDQEIDKTKQYTVFVPSLDIEVNCYGADLYSPETIWQNENWSYEI